MEIDKSANLTLIMRIKQGNNSFIFNNQKPLHNLSLPLLTIFFFVLRIPNQPTCLNNENES